MTGVQTCALPTRVTLETLGLPLRRIQGFHLLWPRFPAVLIFGLGLHIVSRTPDQQADLVWSVPLSLATTYGIAFAFFSSAY